LRYEYVRHKTFVSILLIPIGIHYGIIPLKSLSLGVLKIHLESSIKMTMLTEKHIECVESVSKMSFFAMVYHFCQQQNGFRRYV
jgi:hypothetical protein